MEKVLVEMPNELVSLLNVSKEDLPNQVRLWTVIEMFRQGKVSVALAAKMAGMGRLQFEEFLSDNNIPISSISWNDVQEELSMVNEIREGYNK